jgi:hypothetical protein
MNCVNSERIPTGESSGKVRGSIAIGIGRNLWETIGDLGGAIRAGPSKQIPQFSSQWSKKEMDRIYAFIRHAKHAESQKKRNNPNPIDWPTTFGATIGMKARGEIRSNDIVLRHIPLDAAQDIIRRIWNTFEWKLAVSSYGPSKHSRWWAIPYDRMKIVWRLGVSMLNFAPSRPSISMASSLEKPAVRRSSN